MVVLSAPFGPRFRRAGRTSITTSSMTASLALHDALDAVHGGSGAGVEGVACRTKRASSTVEGGEGQRARSMAGATAHRKPDDREL